MGINMIANLSKTKQERVERLAPVVNGKRVPKHLRLYDYNQNHDDTVCDHYTAVFTGNYRGRNGECCYVAFNSIPTHPAMGFWQHGSSRTVIDYPRYGHLGKKIKYSDLNYKCRELLMREYCEIWELPFDLVKEV